MSEDVNKRCRGKLIVEQRRGKKKRTRGGAPAIEKRVDLYNNIYIYKYI